jgi:hypothetical protein
MVRSMAIAGIFFMGLIAGAILFSIIRALRGRYARTLGLALGIVMGVPLALIRRDAAQCFVIDLMSFCPQLSNKRPDLNHVPGNDSVVQNR